MNGEVHAAFRKNIFEENSGKKNQFHVGRFRPVSGRPRQLASSSAMVQCWKDGGGRGLTAYSTRLNLARLLIILGRHEEGEAAIQAMEKASEGRSSAWSVAYEAKALRKLLK